MSEDVLLRAVVLLESLLIAALAEPAINRMSACAPLIVRSSFHLLTVGALARIVAIVWYADVPSWPTVLTGSGIALMLVSERLWTPRHGDRRKQPAEATEKSRP